MWRVIFVAVLLAIGGCRPKAQDQALRTTPKPAAESAVEATDPEVSDTPTGVEEKGAAPRRPRKDKEVLRRNFVVRGGGRMVGSAVLTVREFRGGALGRIGLEYWLFKRTEPNTQRQGEYWFAGFCSEFRRGQPAALWGTRAWHSDTEQFRLQTQGHKVALSGNHHGSVFGPHAYSPPKGFGYLVALSERMQKSITRRGPAAFTWQRCSWSEESLNWHSYTYTYVGPDAMVSAEGKEYAAHRFDVLPEGKSEPTESVWVDDEGLPLRRVVPSMNGFEMVVSEQDRTNDINGALAWPDAVELFGPEKAALTTKAADMAF